MKDPDDDGETPEMVTNTEDKGIPDGNRKNVTNLKNKKQDQTQFFPLADDFFDYVGVPAEKFAGPRKVLVSLDFLRMLVGIAAGEFAFDLQYYRDRYPDLRKAADDGQVKDLKMHFVHHGFFEGRQGSLRQAKPVDEKYYLDRYPDVADGLKGGAVSTATAHYLTTGRKEGRQPVGDVSEAMVALLNAMHPLDPTDGV